MSRYRTIQKLQARLRSELRAIIESYEEWYWELFEQHPDPTVRDLAAQLLGQFAPNKSKLAAALIRRFAHTRDPDERSGILAAISPILHETNDAQEWLLRIVTRDMGLPRFHAAALEAKILGKDTPVEAINALSWLTTLSERPGAFEIYTDLLFKACTALPVAEAMSLLERMLLMVEDCGMANRLCWGLLQVTFEMEIGPFSIGSRTPDPGSGPVFTWRCSRPTRKIDPERRRRLATVLNQCERLWLDPNGLPIDTNLFRLFGLPSQRKSMEKLAQKGKQ